jgi:hypothetical protein
LAQRCFLVVFGAASDTLIGAEGAGAGVDFLLLSHIPVRLFLRVPLGHRFAICTI